MRDLYGVAVCTATLAAMAWAGRLQRLLRRAARAVKMAEELQRAALPPNLLARIGRRYDRLPEEALALHAGLEPLASGQRGRPKRRPGHNLALRMMKLRMKISGCFRSAQGPRDFATLRSFLSTARKRHRGPAGSFGRPARSLGHLAQPAQRWVPRQ